MFTGRSQQLTLYFGESDRYEHQALYLALVEMLRREGVAGASVLRGIAGFGASSTIHTSTVLRMSMDMPVMLTLVERPERIERVLPLLKQMAPNALITLSEVDVLQAGVPVREGLPDLKVSEVMQREVVTIGPEAPVTEAVTRLLDKNFSALPVVASDGKLLGIVSDQDMLTRGGMRVALELKRATSTEFVAELHRSQEDSTHRVGEVMTAEVATVGPEESLGAAARLMVTRGLKRLPVVDGAGKLIGLVARVDILNSLAAVHLPTWHPSAVKVGSAATVAEVMTREVATAAEDATPEQLLTLLLSSVQKQVLVIDGARRVLGVITDSDLISRVAPQHWPALIEMFVSKLPIETISAPAREHLKKLRARSARDLMTREVATVRQEMPVASALAFSAEKRLKRLPVVDEQERLVGIVGRAEMMRALLAG